jgi:hypothetical protein
LVLVADGAVVAVDAGATGVDGVAAVVEAAAAVVLGAGDDMGYLPFEILKFGNVNGFAAGMSGCECKRDSAQPQIKRHSSDVIWNRNCP